MRALPIFASGLLLGAASPTAKFLAPAEIVAGAPASAWVAIPAEDLLVMTLGDGRQVVIQLAPRFAPVHVENIRKLARAEWFAGTSINRVQDNYVVQWGDATEKKPLPKDVVALPPTEYERPLPGIDFDRLVTSDPYAPAIGHSAGLPVGADPRHRLAWLAHCYATVGVGRNVPPDTGTGAELYVVIGHAPRQLDRNITVVGRVVDGIEALTVLPRGTGDIGFYETETERVPIRSITLASDMSDSTRPKIEMLRTDSPVFRSYANARANRRDEFYVRPAGAADLCNVPVPTRRIKRGG